MTGVVSVSPVPADQVMSRTDTASDDVRSWVLRKIGRDELLDVWLPHDPTIDKLVEGANLFACVALPVVLLNCFVDYLRAKEDVLAHRKRVYAICEDGLFVVSKQPGVSVIHIRWREMLGVSVGKYSSYSSCAEEPNVTILLHGTRTEYCGRCEWEEQNTMELYVADPRRLANHLLRLRNAFTVRPLGIQEQVAPIASSVVGLPAVDIFRIYCSVEGQPDKACIIFVSSNMSGDEVAAEACAALGVTSPNPETFLCKVGKKLPFATALMLKEDDEIVVRL